MGLRAKAMVQASALLSWTLAACFTLLALALLWPALGVVAMDTPLRNTVAILALVCASVAGIAGVGLWQLREWARLPAMLLGAISMLLFPFGTVIGMATIRFLGNDIVKGHLRPVRY